ncbi:Fic family protein [Candidatus Woesebacteria bacterium]|nr:Fic family protein [Candidatus Woesebacteria bacterium]
MAMYTPNFSITNNLLTYISRIEAAKAVIDQAALVPAWEAKFRDEALTRTVHFGTKIEGNDLTQEQAQQVVRLDDVSDTTEVIRRTGLLARERDIQEVINYRNVIAWIDKQQNPVLKQVYTLDTLNSIHKLTVYKLVEEQYAGSLRDKQVIVKSATQGTVVFRPPVSVEIPYLVNDLFAWGVASESGGLHPIFRAAITHYQLVYIHPFIEGNGRTARAMATLVLYTLGYDFKKFFSLEQYFDSDVEAYYQALLSVQQSSNANLTYWLEYFCYGLAIEIDKVKSQVTKLSKDLKLKRQLGKQVALSERQILLLELFHNQEEVTSDDMQKVLPNISVDTVLRDIKDLIQKGVVEKYGVTKGVTYRLAE